MKGILHFCKINEKTLNMETNKKKMKFKITMTIEFDDIYGTEKDEMDWLLREVLNYDADNYYLHSNYFGDELGKVVEINSVVNCTD
jgi:hypothetical protein